MSLPSVAAFKREAERRFRNANPDATNVTIRWDFVSRPCPLADGSGTFRNGYGSVQADGYHQSTIHATTTSRGGWVVRATPARKSA